MKPALLVVAGCLWAAVASAQTDASQAEPLTSERTAAPGNLTLAPSGSSSPLLQVLFEASKDDKSGKVAFGWRTAHDQFEVSASGPISKGSATPISLDGLSDGAKGTFKWIYLSRRSQTPAEYEATERICEPIRQKMMADAIVKAEADWSKAVATAKEYGSALPTPPALLVARDDWEKARAAKKPGDPEPEKPFELRFPCLSSDLPETSVVRWKLEEYAHVNAPIFLFGMDGSVNRTKFDYLDALLAAQSISYVGGSVTVRGGILKPSIASAFVSYTHVHDHNAKGDPESICQPIPDTSATSCTSAVRGGPDLMTRDIIAVEVRRFFSSTTAISPSFKYDWQKNVRALELPVYFIGGSGTAGGVKFNWRSDVPGITAVVFVSAALGLQP
jgi:hypothetical protein